jgi:hypothetical protein
MSGQNPFRARGLEFDAGRTARAADEVKRDRAIRFANGSGDDMFDAVADALELDASVEGHEDSGFGDPLDLLIRAEEEAD